MAAIPIVWGIFPVLHASHGAGFAAGLVTYVLKPDWSDAAEQLEEQPQDRGRSTNGSHATV